MLKKKEEQKERNKRERRRWEGRVGECVEIKGIEVKEE
jgi:hypothetical protein